jgi:hypothetical protein
MHNHLIDKVEKVNKSRNVDIVTAIKLATLKTRRVINKSTHFIIYSYSLPNIHIWSPPTLISMVLM